MKEYFKRQIQLWGEETQNSLIDKKIAIIGCGGLGSSVGIALGSSGIGKIYLVDFDKVAFHNIHRQIAYKLDDEGKFKAQVLAKFIEARSPFVKAYAYNESFNEFKKRDLKYDLIIDCTDNLQSRVEIDEYSKKIKTPWIYGSVEEFNAQVCFFDKSSFKAFKISKRAPAGIATPIVMLVASFQSNLAIRYLANLPIKKDFLYYFYFNGSGELIIDKFLMPTMAS
ncbi:MAG TPA: thiamine biosynthesis protein ThiF [Campylobacterales bacterium]|nr:thiamine biosynthesis protein ThiF [Campylobacterales bacterium]